MKLSVLRMLASAMHNKEIEKRPRSGQDAVELDDEEVIVIIRSEMKKRKDAAGAYERGGRAEAAEKEKKEAEILSSFLPQELSSEELDRIAAEGAKILGASSEKDFGKLMAWAMKNVKGQASGERVSAAVRKKLLGP